MTWQESLEIMVSRTGHERYRELCAEEWPDHAAWRDLVIRQAQEPLPPAIDVDAQKKTPEPAVEWPCCGGVPLPE
jgi:hypothetical protein